MIPSYDDLTPGIPDVIDSETVHQLENFLRGDLARPSDAQEIRRSTPAVACISSVYACLRSQPQTANRELLTAHGEPHTANRESAFAKASASAKATADKSAGQAGDQLLAIARDFSPRVMRVSDVEILIDVSGLGRLIGEPPAIERELRRAIADAGVDAFVAIAPTQTMARLLAHAETAHALTPRHEDHKGHKDGLCAGACGRGPWQQLSVELLRELEVLPPGMNHRDRARPYETLERWGIATLGDLAALPAAELSSRLGRRGIALQRLARGLDARPFVPDPGTPRFVARLELEWPIEELEPLSFVLARLLDPLSAALERADRGAVAVRVELRLTDRTTDARVLQLPAPMRDPRVLRTLLLLDLESGPPPAAIDIVTIELDPAPARITQFSLLERALPSPETLSTLTARLSALAGESRVGSAALVDSHAPGAFAMERFSCAPEASARFAPVGAKGATGASGATGAGAAVRCAAVGATGASNAGAEGAAGASDAHGAGVGAVVLRRQRVPPAIRVSVERGRPVYLAPSRRGMPYGAVVEAAGPWRSSGGWWIAERAENGENAERTQKVEGRGVPPKPRRGAGGPVSPKPRTGEDGPVSPKPCSAAGGPVPPKPRSAAGGPVSPKPRTGEDGPVSPKPRRGAGGPVPPKPRRGEGGWNRDEWDVALKSGAVCRLYRDRSTERWFLEGIYD